jgi:hypothetical protein
MALSVALRIPAFVRAPHLDRIAKLLDSVRDAALEETVPLEAGIVSLRVHDPSQENGIALARRCILCGPRLGNSYLNPPFGQKTVGAFGVSGWVETDLE